MGLVLGLFHAVAIAFLFTVFQVEVSRGANLAVTRDLDVLLVLPDEVGLGAEHPGNADAGHHEEDGLDKGLASVELVVWVDVARRQHHEDESVAVV